MTELASAPITLSPSESMLTGKQSFFRRASVTRGTISSMAKDVRSADAIPTIRRQTSQHFTPDTLSLLTRRKSMMNLSTRIPNTTTTTNNPKALQQQPRIRTMSTADLLTSNMQQKLVNIKTLKRQRDAAVITKPENAISATFQNEKAPPCYQKTVTKEDNSFYNLRKCEACNPDGIPSHHHHHIQNKQNTNWEDDNNNWSTSTAPDGYSSSCQSSLQKGKWQYESLLENLNSSFAAYSNQMQDLSSTFIDGSSSSLSSLSSLSDYDDDSTYHHRKSHRYKSQIQECKSLISQQQDILSKLEALIEEKEAERQQKKLVVSNTPTTATSSAEQQQQADWKAAFSDLLKPKSSGVSEVVFRRSKENEPDKTVIVVSGTGTTTEVALLPKHIPKTNKSIQYVEYKLSITLDDRKNRFILMPEIKWQNDKKVDQCEFARKEQGARCSVQFGWTWRKHHCRRCGHIYCSTHSANRLPLFQQNASDQPVFSRVCDGCFFDLSAPYLLLP
ncbi:hypothetical protein K501DRAFT_235939 [Backusella circina FSU 941]|nr:hypothetical protein K501DRAFT_235939 [Backusella circina FSU 941]